MTRICECVCVCAESFVSYASHFPIPSICNCHNTCVSRCYEKNQLREWHIFCSNLLLYLFTFYSFHSLAASINDAISFSPFHLNAYFTIYFELEINLSGFYSVGGCSCCFVCVGKTIFSVIRISSPSIYLLIPYHLSVETPVTEALCVRLNER